MRLLTLFLILLVNAFVLTNATAQDMPLVYPVEETCTECEDPYFPSFGELPVIEGLPDPFEWSDGRGRIAFYSDWEYRRAEIKAEVEHYEVGEKPTEMDSLTASYDNGTLTVNVYRNGQALTLTTSINLPEGTGPFPAVIGMGFTSMPDSVFSNRDVAQMNFNYGQVMAHTQTRGNEPINDLFPELEHMGAYSAWPWGVSRLIDGLELVAEEAMIDTEHLAVSGCSFAGKMALYSGALDERIALTFAIESGGGGYTTWRYNEVLGDVERLTNTSYAWFLQSLSQFSSNVGKLPFDHHEVMALVAPRALFVTGNPGWTWLADESGYVGSNATKEVYEALGVGDRFAYSQIGGHNHCAIPAEQIPEITAFVDRFLLGEDVNTEVATSPYTTNLGPWIPWETPTLTEGTSFLGKTTLVEPEDQASGLDTEVDFSWDAYEGAQKYYFQLSTTGAFNTVFAEDSTTNTAISIDSLDEGKKYYWRIQVRNADGTLGPWTRPNSLITFVELPEEPTLFVGRIARPSRPSSFYFEWGSDPWADQYRLEVSPDDIFEDPYTAISTSDTTRTLSILDASEGETLYWRVNAKNLAGSGPWSQTATFYILAPPDDLDLDNETSGQITLEWDDNSDIEEGFIIERKVYSADTFSVIDTIAADSEKYVDASIGEDEYTYRVKAFTADGNSDYSEAVSTVVTSSETETGVPMEYSLSQNYPNPFNPSTNIKFSLPKAGLTRMVVYDVLGRQVSVPLNKVLEAGYHELTFDASDLPSGVYLYQIETGSFVQTKKMILMK
jgi:hypothetical protein